MYNVGADIAWYFTFLGDISKGEELLEEQKKHVQDRKMKHSEEERAIVEEEERSQDRKVKHAEEERAIVEEEERSQDRKVKHAEEGRAIVEEEERLKVEEGTLETLGSRLSVVSRRLKPMFSKSSIWREANEK
jgi:hypothetical protein